MLTGTWLEGLEDWEEWCSWGPYMWHCSYEWQCSYECCGCRVWYQLRITLLILQKPKDWLFQPAPCGSTRLEYQCCRVTGKKVPR